MSVNRLIRALSASERFALLGAGVTSAPCADGIADACSNESARAVVADVVDGEGRIVFFISGLLPLYVRGRMVVPKTWAVIWGFV